MRKFATASLAAALTVSVVVAAIVTLYAGQPTSVSHEQVVTQGTRLPGQESKNTLPAPRQTEANQRAQAQKQVQQAESVPGQALKDERAEALAQELAEARRALETLEVQLRAELTKSAQSLEQERQKTATLAQEAAAARQALTAHTTRHRLELDDERTRGDALVSRLATARREIEKQAALLKVSEEKGQFTQTQATKSAQSLESTAALAQEAAARGELTASTTRHRQELDNERTRSNALASELAKAQREIETQVALLKASDETGQLRQEEATTSAQSLEQERQKSAALLQEVSAARQELTASATRHRQELDNERTRSDALASELAAARREIEKQVALSNANDKQAADIEIAEPRKSPQQEPARIEARARNVESARRTVDAPALSEPAPSRPISKAALQAGETTAMAPPVGFAGSVEWQRYLIPSTGANVDIPVDIFTEDAGPPKGGVGRRFFTRDRRADLTIQSVRNPDNDSPAAFLAKRQPPADIQYKRVTPRFFAVSSVRNGRTWYNRCNRASGHMNCVLINYPAVEERRWDAVVTRISLSLSK